MEGNDVGLLPPACGGADGAAEAVERVGVIEADVRLADECPEQRQGKQVAAFFIHGSAVGGAETEERIDIRVAIHGDAADLIMVPIR